MKKRFLAIFIVVMMLFSQITVFASVPDSSTTSINPEDKLTDELKDVMSNTADDEYISISVWLYEMDDSYIYNIISEHYGVEINQNNESAFLQKQVNDKTEKFYSITSKNEMTMQASEITIQSNNQITNEINAIRNNSVVNDTISDNDLREFIQSGKDISELIARSEQNAYMKEWRNARKNINTLINTSFESSLDLNKCKNVCIDSLIGYATLEARNSYILTIASSIFVKKIDIFIEENTELLDMVDETTVETTTEPLGYHMFQSKLPNGYTGTGVRVGVLEVTDDDDATYVVHYDTSNVHLADKTNILTRLDPGMATERISTTEFDRHATNVLVILCGNPVEATNGIVYQGIAPDASVYYTNVFSDINSVCEGIVWLIEQNVDVINLSAALEDTLSYGAWDCYFDCIVQQYKVAITVAGGNGKNGTTVVSHPGQGYNVITVGYSTMNATETNDYILNGNSNFVEHNKGTNKPDLVAFGTNIYSLDNDRNPTSIYEINEDGETVRISGSSFATPMVTGTIALMLQKNPLLANKPNEIKAVLVASANDEQVDEEHDTNTNAIDNPLDCENPYENTTYVTATGIIRDKTGAGILNIKNSVENATGAIMWSYTFSSNEISTNTSRSTEEYYFIKNTKFKLGLIFDKNDHDWVSTSNLYGNDINIEMIDAQTNEVVFRSRPSTSDTSPEVISSEVNNVELFDIEIKKTGNYRFRIYFKAEDIYDSSGATIPPYHEDENTHTSLNATIVIACSCLETNITNDTTELSNGYYYKVHSCGGNGCIYTAYEKVYASTCQDSISVGCVEYKMEYQVVYVNGNREFLYEDFTVICNLNDTSKTCMVHISGKDIEYTALGYIETIRYETFVFDNTGALYNIYDTDVKVEYDNMTRLIYVYN